MTLLEFESMGNPRSTILPEVDRTGNTLLARSCGSGLCPSYLCAWPRYTAYELEDDLCHNAGTTVSWLSRRRTVAPLTILRRSPVRDVLPILANI